MMEPSKSTENLQGGGEDSTCKVTVIVVVIALVVAAIALVLAIVAMSGNGKTQIIYPSADDSDSRDGSSSPQTGGGSVTDGDDDRIWQLSFEHTGSNYGYIDDTSGELRGFQIDLATAVCQIAGKNCELVYDTPTRCWESLPGARPQGGEGLMARYYDACVGWVASYDRPRTFKFSKAYTYPIKTVFMTKRGNPDNFDWQVLTGKTIGFVDGWAYDEHCIAREKDQITGWDLAVDQIVRYPGRQELYDGLQAGDVHAIFDNAAGWIAGDSQIEIVSTEILSCAVDGFSVMMRKDNPLKYWWDDAFEKLKQTSQWRSICNDLNDEHGHRGGPKPQDFCIDY